MPRSGEQAVVVDRLALADDDLAEEIDDFRRALAEQLLQFVVDCLVFLLDLGDVALQARVDIPASGSCMPEVSLERSASRSPVMTAIFSSASCRSSAFVSSSSA